MWKYERILVLVALVLAVLGWQPGSLLFREMSYPVFLAQVFSVLLINSLVLFLVYYGQKQENKTAMLFTLGALASKLVLYLFAILTFYLVLKNISMEFILSFFLLYLLFTFATVVMVFKILDVNKIKGSKS